MVVVVVALLRMVVLLGTAMAGSAHGACCMQKSSCGRLRVMQGVRPFIVPEVNVAVDLDTLLIQLGAREIRRDRPAGVQTNDDDDDDARGT